MGQVKLVDADPHRRQKVIAQDFSGMDRRQAPPGRDVGKIHGPPIDVFAPDAHGLGFSLTVEGALLLACTRIGSQHPIRRPNTPK